jgi:hypothetical protein
MNGLNGSTDAAAWTASTATPSRSPTRRTARASACGAVGAERGVRRALTTLLVAGAAVLIGILPVTAAIAAPPVQTSTLSAKQISAPPEDLLDGTLRLVDPPTEVSRHALIPAVARSKANDTNGVGGWLIRQSVPHAGGSLAIAVLVERLPAPSAPWQLRISAPDGTVVFSGPVEQPVARERRREGVGHDQNDAADPNARGPAGVRRGSLASLMVGGEGVQVARVDLADAAQGEWLVELAADGTRAEREAGGVAPQAVIVIAPDDGIALRCTAADWRARVGIPKTYLLDAVSERDGLVLVESVEATLTTPDGVVEPLPVAGATASFLPTRSGSHVLHAIATLRAQDGSRTRRSATVIVEIADSALALRGQGRLEPLDALRERVLLEVDGMRRENGRADHPDGAARDESVFVCGEVWLRSVDDRGVVQEQPICWIGSMVEPSVDERDGARPERHLQLAFDRRWLGRAVGTGRDAAAPQRITGELSLREVRVHDRASGSLLDRIPRISLGPAPMPAPFDPREESSLLRGRAGGHAIRATVTPTALPSNDAPSDSDAPTGSHALMLVHGYCSGGSPFPANHFTGAVAQFLDPNVARSHDEFAQLIAAFGANFKSYGTVAHSQGGMASLHLYTFYWSGLDWAEGPRLIQSVGAPYQGTPLAGNLAVLGGIFGVGCGSVADMTPEGSTAWLSTIPTWARQRVWYWTTSYKDFPFSYDYCDFISDLFLSNPDDGVIERVRGQLPGGNNMGHTEGWCHVADMEDPPQCTDQARNTQMNANAAR